MKLQSVGIALIAFVLMSPVLTFADGQRTKEQPSTAGQETQDRPGSARHSQQGKGGGMSLSDRTIRANAYRVQTGDDVGTTEAASRTVHPNYSDPAFTK